MWRKKFLTDTESVKDAAKSERPYTVTGKQVSQKSGK